MGALGVKSTAYDMRITFKGIYIMAEIVIISF